MDHMRHYDGTRDTRYTIRREWVGKSAPQWVVRFCDAWIGCAATQMSALDIACRHQAGRYVAMGVARV